MSRRPGAVALLALAAVAIAGCGGKGKTAPSDPAAVYAATEALCDKAYAGKVVADEPASSDPVWQQPAVLYVRCAPGYRLMSLTLGDDRSRVWQLGQTGQGLLLRHTHHHDDGSADVVSGYGGFARATDTPGRIEFPADDNTKAMFLANDLQASVDNVWALELDGERMLAYELNRPNRHFRIEFDLTETVPTPPLPWAEAAVR